MIVAILGSNGYLGKFLTNRLSADQTVTVIPVNKQTIDLTNHNSVLNFLQTNKIDTVINCAVAGGNLQINDVNYKVLQDNLNIFLNFYNNSKYFKKFINIGSGSEFNTKTDIDNAIEDAILNAYPTESYAYSKNIISRLVLENDKFFTLRLFGCFDKTEHEFRLLKKFSAQTSFSLMDRKFDYISASDFYKIVDHYLKNDSLQKDINCVYGTKHYLSEILTEFKSLHHIDTDLKIEGINILNYTGNANKLNSLNLNLDGLQKGLELYFN
jgi:nucleoside-diphosphate-sugar epimerase